MELGEVYSAAAERFRDKAREVSKWCETERQNLRKDREPESPGVRGSDVATKRPLQYPLTYLST